MSNKRNWRSLQNLFDEAYAKLWEQNEIAYDPIAKSCCYTTPDGRRCAVGHLIRSVIPPALNIQAISGLISPSKHQTDPILAKWEAININEMKAILDDNNIRTDTATLKFLASLQYAHDDLFNVNKADFRKRLNDNFALLAADYKLTFTQKPHSK